MLKSTYWTNFNQQVSQLLDNSLQLINLSIDNCKEATTLQTEAWKDIVVSSVETAKNVCQASCPREVATEMQGFATMTWEMQKTQTERLNKLWNGAKNDYIQMTTAVYNTWQESCRQAGSNWTNWTKTTNPTTV